MLFLAQPLVWGRNYLLCFPRCLPSHRKPRHVLKREAIVLQQLCSHITSQLPTEYTVVAETDVKEVYQTQPNSHAFLFSEHLEIQVVIIKSLTVCMLSCISAYYYNQCKIQSWTAVFYWPVPAVQLGAWAYFSCPLNQINELHNLKFILEIPQRVEGWNYLFNQRSLFYYFTG